MAFDSKDRAEEVHGVGNVQECPACQGWHSKYSPPTCHACTFGL